MASASAAAAVAAEAGASAEGHVGELQQEAGRKRGGGGGEETAVATDAAATTGSGSDESSGVARKRPRQQLKQAEKAEEVEDGEDEEGEYDEEGEEEEEEPRCCECGWKSSDAPSAAAGEPGKPREMDGTMQRVFGETVCSVCRVALRKYQLLTKADVQQSYLLPDGTVRMLAFLEKPNPRNENWTRMRLYLRKHAERSAYTRWGGEQGLLAEKNRRESAKFERLAKKTKDVFRSKSRGKNKNQELMRAAMMDNARLREPSAPSASSGSNRSFPPPGPSDKP